MLSSLIINAQTRITGKVTASDDQQPVIGASVKVKGSTTGSLTGPDGTFSINAKAGDVLVISYIGYDVQQITVGSATNYNVSISQAVSDLNEVIVTGYSSQRKKDITGSVAVVNVKDMKAIPAGSPEQMLQGRAAGLNVTTSGEPGGGSNIRIRGITSLGNNDPLVMIDGVQGSLRNINENDIESIQVLKDAGSAAVYGVRGSNGVIIVTTKKGKSGKASINYDAYYGRQLPKSGNVFNLANTQQMADITWLALRNSGAVDKITGNPVHPQYGSGASPVIPDYLVIGSTAGVVGQPTQAQLDQYNNDYAKGGIYQIIPANKQGTDWFHEIFNPAPMQSHTISASGAAEKSSYLFSLGYLNQEGTLMNTGLKRYGVRANTSYNIKDRIRVGENVYIFNRSSRGTPSGNQNEGNPISMAYRQQPIIPVFDAKGGYGGTRAPGLGNGQNPYAQLDRIKDNNGNQWDIQGNVYAEADLVKNLTARTSFGGTLNNNYGYGFGYQTYENAENNSSNSFGENASYNRNWTWTNTLTYNYVIGKHSIKALAGLEAVQFYGRGVSGNALGYFSTNPSFWNLTNGSSGFTNGSYAYQEALSSQFADLNYAYNDRYFVGGTVRRDGSSRFGPEKRWGVFPSVKLGWRVSQENFMKSATWLNNLMIRGSYGILGSYLNVDPTNAFSQFGGGPGSSYYDINGTSSSSQQGFNTSRIGNPNTGWEEDILTNIGFDATLFNSKLDFSAEYYEKSVQGLLYGDQAPATVGGAALPAVNIGNIENKGFDFSLTYHGTAGSDFKYDINGILGQYKSNITSLPGDYFDAGGTRIGNVVRNQVGRAIGEFYGYKVQGLWQSQAEVDAANTVTRSKPNAAVNANFQDAAAPGRFRYEDVDGDGKISDSDRTFFGNPNPDFTYGLNLSASYKGFDFSTFFYGSQGNDAINYVKYWTDFYQSFQGVKSLSLLNNSWTPQRTNTSVPIAENNSNFSNNQVINSYYLEDGSFLKMRSLVFGYTLPTIKSKKFGVDKLRVYLQATNLFTLTKYTGVDPELTGGTTAFGIDFGNYPNNQAQYNIGVNLSF